MPVYETRHFRVLCVHENEFKKQLVYRIWGLTGGVLSELLALLLHGDDAKTLKE